MGQLKVRVMLYEGTDLCISRGDAVESRDHVVVRSWCSGGGDAMLYLGSAVALKTS